MLRIDPIDIPAVGTTLRLAGRLVGPWVGALRGACEDARRRGPLTLDLAGVSFIDPDGIVLLQTLRGPDVTLVNGSPFVTEQLRGAPR